MMRTSTVFISLFKIMFYNTILPYLSYYEKAGMVIIIYLSEGDLYMLDKLPLSAQPLFAEYINLIKANLDYLIFGIYLKSDIDYALKQKENMVDI